jgi:GT2 family glycosyltransferase
MFIRRRLIREIGVFDDVFGKGYGEENDFSMRARRAGYRNVLCDDTFVVHQGSRSFGSHMPSMIEANMVKLLAKHPDYMVLVREFIDKDPLKPIRSMIHSRVGRCSPSRTNQAYCMSYIRVEAARRNIFRR